MKHLSEIGKITALLSFVLGTCLFVFYLYFGQRNSSIIIGFYFVIIVVCTNLLLMLILLIAALANKPQRNNLLKTCGIMLLNIPVAALYMYLVLITSSLI
ncbi:MAG: hypothetical protein ACK5MZ_10525 [Aestuariibaculum sp.]